MSNAHANEKRKSEIMCYSELQRGYDWVCMYVFVFLSIGEPHLWRQNNETVPLVIQEYIFM